MYFLVGIIDYYFHYFAFLFNCKYTVIFGSSLRRVLVYIHSLRTPRKLRISIALILRIDQQEVICDLLNSITFILVLDELIIAGAQLLRMIHA